MPTKGLADLTREQKRLTAGGFNSEAELDQSIAKTEKVLQRARNKELGIDEDEGKASGNDKDIGESRMTRRTDEERNVAGAANFPSCGSSGPPAERRRFEREEETKATESRLRRATARESREGGRAITTGARAMICFIRRLSSLMTFNFFWFSGRRNP
jgi:hypothetical protein